MLGKDAAMASFLAKLKGTFSKRARHSERDDDGSGAGAGAGAGVEVESSLRMWSLLVCCEFVQLLLTLRRAM